MIPNGDRCGNNSSFHRVSAQRPPVQSDLYAISGPDDFDHRFFFGVGSFFTSASINVINNSKVNDDCWQLSL